MTDTPEPVDEPGPGAFPDEEPVPENEDVTPRPDPEAPR